MIQRVVWQNGNKTTERIVEGTPTYDQADEVGKRLGLGIAILIEDNEGTILYRAYNFFRDIRNTVREGIPICCGLNFAWDSLTDRQHVIHRWRNDIQYVPCWIHLHKLGGKQPVPEGTF